jgi:hypothetical protein
MAKVVTPIQARVEIIGKPKESQYNPGTYYYPTLFIDQAQPEGSDAAKIWKSLSGDEVSQIVKGDLVQLVPAGEDKSGKPKHNIVVMQSAAPSPKPQQPDRPSGIAKETKQQIAAFLDTQGDLYHYCYIVAKAKLEDLSATEVSVSVAAQALYQCVVSAFELEQGL